MATHTHRTALAVILTGIAAILVIGGWWEPRTVSLTGIHIKEGRLAHILNGRTVALLSDLHISGGGNPVVQKVLQRLAELKPDMILVAGDLVAWGGRDAAYERALDFLARLKAPLGVFAVLGDADRTFSRKSCEFCHCRGTGEPTRRHTVVLLKDEERLVQTGNRELRIVGIDAAPRRPLTAVQRRLLDQDSPTIVLSHSSLVYTAARTDKDLLVVSGDTHGGQVRLPAWFWRVIRPKPDPEHMHGLSRDGRKTLFVTRGIGTSRLHFRLGVPPEIVLFSFGDTP